MINKAKKKNDKKVVTQKEGFTSDNIPQSSSVTKNKGKAWGFIYHTRKNGHNYYKMRWTDKNGNQHTEYLGSAEIIREAVRLYKSQKNKQTF